MVTESRRRDRPTGRRAGDSGTRDAILNAALDLFAANGYDGASIRAIAASAGVDPGLVRHFYGDKKTLFATALADRTAVVQRLGEALAGDQAGVGERAARAYLELWEDPDTRPVLLALVRSATTSDQAAQMLIELLGGRIEPQIRDTEDAARRLALAASHMLGLAIARYVVKLPTIATASVDELVREVAPSMQRYLAGTDI